MRIVLMTILSLLAAVSALFGVVALVAQGMSDAPGQSAGAGPAFAASIICLLGVLYLRGRDG
jgi:di/tricarboxylate transporter